MQEAREKDLFFRKALHFNTILLFLLQHLRLREQHKNRLEGHNKDFQGIVTAYLKHCFISFYGSDKFAILFFVKIHLDKKVEFHNKDSREILRFIRSASNILDINVPCLFLSTTIKSMRSGGGGRLKREA